MQRIIGRFVGIAHVRAEPLEKYRTNRDCAIAMTCAPRQTTALCGESKSPSDDHQHQHHTRSINSAACSVRSEDGNKSIDEVYVSFYYNIVKIRMTPPGTPFSEVKRIATNSKMDAFGGSMAVMIDSSTQDELLVRSEWQTKQVEVFSTRTGTKHTLLGFCATPNGLATDAQERVYIADTDRHAIVEVTPGTRTARTLYSMGNSSVGHGRLNVPTDVAISAFDELFVSDSSDRRVWVFGPSRELSHTFKTFEASAYPFRLVTMDGVCRLCVLHTNRNDIAVHSYMATYWPISSWRAFTIAHCH